MSNCGKNWHASKPICHEWRVDPNDPTPMTSGELTPMTPWRVDPNDPNEKFDGFWVNENGRWWENDPVLVTTYSLLSIEILQARRYP
jgi:hypothetical protein